MKSKRRKGHPTKLVQKLKVQFSANVELIRGIERAKELLSNKLGAAASMEDVFTVIINEYIEQNTPKENADKKTSTKALEPRHAATGNGSQKRTRFIAKKVKELLQVRDGMCCNYTSAVTTNASQNSKLSHANELNVYKKEKL